MTDSRLPGPTCQELKKRGKIDKGTSCRSDSKPPGPTTWRERAFQQMVAQKKKEYLEHARKISYVMQAKAWADDSHSVLGGKFLRMYLDDKVDPAAIKQAGEEIAASKTYAGLTKRTNKRIQYHINKRYKRMLNEKEIATRARKYLQYRQRKGLAFRGYLNPVIGGVSGIDVEGDARILSKMEVGKEILVNYEVKVVFKDTYDFDNSRKGEYDRYRKKLAKLLQQNKFGDFELMYYREQDPSGYFRKTKLSHAGLFASYMYALEKRGWTPGPLAWEVTIPMRGSLKAPKRRPRKKGRRKSRRRAR